MEVTCGSSSSLPSCDSSRGKGVGGVVSLSSLMMGESNSWETVCSTPKEENVVPLAEGICFCWEGFAMGDGLVSGLVEEEGVGVSPCFRFRLSWFAGGRAVRWYLWANDLEFVFFGRGHG